MLKPTLALLATVAGLVIAPPAHAFLSDDNPDSYSRLEDQALLEAYLNVLASAGESSAGKLHVFHLPVKAGSKSDGAANSPLVVHAVQDRGLPRGSEYPTYVFTSTGVLEEPELIFNAHAGTRLFLAEDASGETQCLMSAEKGWSDICLADIHGNAAPDMPGLRKDFWSDLLKLFGF